MNDILSPSLRKLKRMKDDLVKQAIKEVVKADVKRFLSKGDNKKLIDELGK